ncbi:AAA family ATPase (plasmid) [Nicoliella spurrieriana]|uniref:AAA family ATPase n=1 Tax=Nicoliella spurrieriana TaxID=2925830 RepID=A0A976X4P1_9LACO|nr:AAA family ATPase [Nicoliella spurrieriana]UQS86173.1 AAA family ATPase [Nicoliella spurrieriana]
MKISSVRIDNFRQLKNIEDFDIGNKLTVISGPNGIGKSSILSLISSSCGTKDKRIENVDFQPDFNDYFYISKNENYKDYRVFISFTEENVTFKKKIRVKNDSGSKRGIRVLPQTYKMNDDETIKAAGENLYNNLGIGATARVPLPSIYLSMSRLFPLGESNITIKDINPRNKIMKDGLSNDYRDLYNSVIPNSINSDASMDFITKEATQKTKLNMKINNTIANTQSVGQDNLSYIISAIISFYNLKMQKGDEYKGGVLCIDEIDSSLHPGALDSLISLLIEISDKLNLQIILTTHSLLVLKKIIELQNENSDDYKLVYFSDTSLPSLSKYTDYELLKSDLFDKSTFERPPLKVYCEDSFGAEVFGIFFDIINKVDPKLLSENEILQRTKLDIFPLGLGKEQLKNMRKSDKYFKKVLIVLDGDARLKNGKGYNNILDVNDTQMYPNDENTCNPHANNILYLPSFLPPELFLFELVKDYVDNPIKHTQFWNTVKSNSDTALLNISHVKKDLHIDDENVSFKPSGKNNGGLINRSIYLHENKDFQKNIINFVKKTSILVDYYKNSKDGKNQINEYYKHLIIAIKDSSNKKVSDFFN